MNIMMATLLHQLHAFLECPYKAFLLAAKQSQEADALEFTIQKRVDAYREAAREHYRMQSEPSGRRRHQWIHICAEDSTDRPEGGAHGVECLVEGRQRKRKSDVESTPLHIPVKLVPAERLSKHHRIALALEGLALSKCGYKVATRGTIVYGSAFKTVAVSLEALNAKAGKMLQEVESVQSGTSTPALRLNPHCKVCRFAQHCHHVALEKDDLSLMPSLSAKEIGKLNRKGIFTTTQLSYTFRPRRKRRHKTPEKYNPALKALALRERTVYVNQLPQLPRAPVQIFLDVESLPDRDFYYLIGLRINGECADELHSLWADSVEDEERIWNGFLRLLEPYGEYSILHFGSYESRFIDRMFKKYSSAAKATESRVKASLVNILSFCRTNVYFPVYSNGLKDIAAHLGFQRESPIASGLHSIEWRLRWESHREDAIKKALIDYNQEDCSALQLLTSTLIQIEERSGAEPGAIRSVEQMKIEKPFRLGRNVFEIPEFDYINKCAYFDYQRSKVYWRTDDDVRKSFARGRRRAARRKHRINKIVRCPRPRKCPACHSPEVVKHQAHSRTVYDLRFRPGGVARWVTRYVGWRYICNKCGKTFNSKSAPGDKAKYGHQVLAWCIYHCIGLKQSQISVVVGLGDIFGVSVHGGFVAVLKSRAAQYYRGTYEEIKRKLLLGRVIHVDETRVSIKGAVGYVWVFANLQEVLYVYSDSREGEIIPKVLDGFKGVLVSDFYPAYESMPYVQQRCLIHLIRDLNDDLFKNPFDLEFKALVIAFGQLLRPIISTIDTYGLKKRFLGKHKAEVERFFRQTLRKEYASDLGRKYQTRLRKNQHWLFTFLDYDGVPWNNNNAENAIKGFASLRQVIGGCSTEKGLRDSLRLLSISQTLRNKNISFLAFLRSGKKKLRSRTTKD